MLDCEPPIASEVCRRARPPRCTRARCLAGACDKDSRVRACWRQVRYGRSESTRQYYSRGGVLVPGASAGTGSGPPRPAGTGGSALGHLWTACMATWASFQQLMYATFLPAGFPASLPPEYLRYQAWNVVQDLSSSLRGVLCTQKILEGMGVGNAAMTSLAATMLWMARDGSAMLGGLAFTALASQDFGADVKRWRLFADLINDVALLLDMLAPMWPHLFLPIICLSSIFKAMCGVSAVLFVEKSSVYSDFLVRGKVLYVVTLYSQYTMAMTVENLLYTYS